MSEAKATVYTVTNEAKGARYIGAFLIEPESTVETVELSEEDALALGDLDGVTVKEAKTKPAKAEPEADPLDHDADGRKGGVKK